MRTRAVGSCVAAFAWAILCAPVAGQQTFTLPAEDRPIDVPLELVYSVGRAVGSPWEQFHSLDAAAFGADGRLHLLDESGQAIVAVGPSGSFLHTVGRAGSGPGEYEHAAGLGVLSGGGVAVWDDGKRAFLLFGRDGASLDQVRPDYESGVPASPFAVLADGTLLSPATMIVTGSRGRLYFTETGFEPLGGSLPLLRTPLEDGAPTRVALRLDLPDDGGAPGPATRAFEPEPSWALLAGATVAVVQSDDYRIDLLTLDGSPKGTLVRPLPERPVTERDREAFRRGLREQYERLLGSATGGLRPAPPDRPVSYHPVVPPIRRITSDGARHVWVQRPHADDPTRPGPIDLLTVGGRYLGTAHDLPGLPAAFGPDGLVVFLTVDALDVPVARVYRLPERLRS